MIKGVAMHSNVSKSLFAGIVRGLILAMAGALLPAVANAEDASATLHFLSDKTPGISEGVTWGTPWAEGQVQKGDALKLAGADGKSIPLQTWPLAYWPDGSLKWTGHAIVAEAETTGPLTLSTGAPAAPATAIQCTTDGAKLTVDTGAVKCVFLAKGSSLIDSMFVGDREVAKDGRLIAVREEKTQTSDGKGNEERSFKDESFVSKIKSVSLEQSGPVRATVKVEGMHASASGREWLPFVVRFYFYAGTGEIRVVHSFIFDGDVQKDFIKGLGMAFTVPFKEELQNRQARFAGDGTGVWVQPVLLLPGYRDPAGIGDAIYADQLAGKRTPNLAEYAQRQQSAIQSCAVYNAMKLTQLSPEGFSIDKQTQPKSSWLHVTNGKRSLGYALLGDVSGGIAVGVKDFWQKYPASLEIEDAATSNGQLNVWFWSPDADPMDMRTYDVVPHGLNTNYEDFKPGWGDAYGVAETHDLTLWAYSAIPSPADSVKEAHVAALPGRLVNTPEYYHALPLFGDYSLPDRSTPAQRWVEDQLVQVYDYFHGQVDERSWYGFWNYGDFMHNYDFGRHDWRYDIGGWAWMNTELAPDMFLWFSFLRTGRTDMYRSAEAMTRETSEVDIHHIGYFAPLGSRHNVNHWGDGAKQPRISQSGLKRFFYYLEADERVGDLMREQLGAKETYDKIRATDPGHFEGGPEGEALAAAAPLNSEGKAIRSPNAGGAGGRGARGGRGGRGGGRRGGAAGAAGTSATQAQAPRGGRGGGQAGPGGGQGGLSFGLDWICYAINWTTEYERTGNTAARDHVLAMMKEVEPETAEGGLRGSGYFDIIFGGAEDLAAMKPMYDDPLFWAGWASTALDTAQRSNGGNMTAPRLYAYAASVKKDPELGVRAWQTLIGDAIPDPTKDTPIAQPERIDGPEVIHPVTDPIFLGRSVGWQLHGVATVQWCLNAMETLKLAAPYLPQWEAQQKAYVAEQATGRRGGGRRGGGARGGGGAPADPAAEQ